MNALSQVPFIFTAHFLEQVIWFVSIIISCAIGTHLANRYRNNNALMLEPLVNHLGNRQDEFAKKLVPIDLAHRHLQSELKMIKAEQEAVKSTILRALVDHHADAPLPPEDQPLIAERQNTLDKEIDVLMSEYKKTNELIPALVKQCDERLSQQDYRVQSRMDIMDSRVTHTLENCQKLILMMEKQNKRKRAPRSQSQGTKENCV